MFHSTSLAHTESTLAISMPSSTIVSIATPQAKPTPTIIVISQPSSFSDPSTVIAMLGLIIAAVTLFFIIKYVRDTAAMAKATRDSADATRDTAKAAENTLQEMKEARDEENAPFVIVYFNYIQGHPTGCATRFTTSNIA